MAIVLGEVWPRPLHGETARVTDGREWYAQMHGREWWTHGAFGWVPAYRDEAATAWRLYAEQQRQESDRWQDAYCQAADERDAAEAREGALALALVAEHADTRLAVANADRACDEVFALRPVVEAARAVAAWPTRHADDCPHAYCEADGCVGADEGDCTCVVRDVVALREMLAAKGPERAP